METVDILLTQAAVEKNKGLLEKSLKDPAATPAERSQTRAILVETAEILDEFRSSYTSWVKVLAESHQIAEEIRAIIDDIDKTAPGQGYTVPEETIEMLRRGLGELSKN